MLETGALESETRTHGTQDRPLQKELFLEQLTLLEVRLCTWCEVLGFYTMENSICKSGLLHLEVMDTCRVGVWNSFSGVISQISSPGQSFSVHLRLACTTW